jgi:ABC-2 type transport system ATP-binding protein
MTQYSPALELINLSKYYGKHRGVIDLNISVNPGEIFGYLGPNGAGKSTTMRLLLDFIRPTSGSARIFGLDTQSESLAIRRHVGYLSTAPALYGNLTAQEFLRYCSNLKGGCDWSYVHNLTERLDCDMNRKIDTLSHGNKQKIAIVRAFMHRPALVILDEPTTGLDPLVQHEFENILRETVEDGNTVLLSSHILSEVEGLCDRVGIIREGQLVAVEQVADLKAKQVRELQITFGSDITEQLFEGIDGVTNILVDGRHLKCDITGSLDELIKRASELQVLDIVTQAPSLEDVFLAYYGGK